MPFAFSLFPPARQEALQLSRNLYKSTLFMQNKPNFQIAKMNIKSFITKNYEDSSDLALGENKPNSKPIQTQTDPIPETTKMNLRSVITTNYANRPTEGSRKTNPILQKAQMNLTTCPTWTYQNQPRSGSKSNSNPIAQKPKMNLSSVITRDCQNEPSRAFWKTNPNKPNLW